MLTNPIFIALVFITAVCCFIVARSFLLSKKTREENQGLQRNISGLNDKLESFIQDKQQLEKEKIKLEEKNKKVWQMSETVYKEKHKVDEENTLLSAEKAKLEAEKKKVDEKVKKLWSQSTAIHKEKERINELKIEIEHRHQEILDSVNYAKRIQEAILPDRKDIFAYLPDSFILFKPRDIVSGDFYWFTFKNGKCIIAAIDCTGHGVPGAFMSMIGNTLLNQIVNENGITDTSMILTQLNKEINHSLKQTQETSDSRDGMDIAICCFDMEKMEMQYAGAMRPLYFIRNKELTETKGSKFAIGGLDYDGQKVFVTHTFQLQKGDAIIISTDGYADQFGPEDKKIMTRKFKEVLASIQDRSMEEQGRFLDEFHNNWKQQVEQTDDVLVIGIKI